MAKEKVHRISVKAMVVHEGRLLLIRKRDQAGDYYIFPGGGQEHGESLDQTLTREVREETGYAVEAGDLVVARDYIGANHEFRADSSHFHQVELYFSAKLCGPEQGAAELPDSGQIGIEWVPLEQVRTLRIYPLALRDVFAGQMPARIYAGDVN